MVVIAVNVMVVKLVAVLRCTVQPRKNHTARSYTALKIYLTIYNMQKLLSEWRNYLKEEKTITVYDHYIPPFIRALKAENWADAADKMNEIYDYVDGKQNPDSKKRIAREFKNTIASRVAKEVANHPQVTAKEGVTEWLWSTTKDMSIVKPYILLHVALTGKSLDTIIRKYEDMTKDHKESLKGN